MVIGVSFYDHQFAQHADTFPDRNDPGPDWLVLLG